MVDWQAILEGRSDGLSTPVAGVRVGDDAGLLSGTLITHTEPRGPLEELGKRGGYAYAEGITYMVAEGRVQRIAVFGAAVLRGLPFKQEADIEKALGASIGVERKHGTATHYFPDRSLSVGWSIRDNRVGHAGFGPVEWTPPTFSAQDVLKEWLAAKWEPPGPSDYGKAREARLLALLRAFQLGEPEGFADGDFLKGRSPSEYPRSMAILELDPHPLDDPGIIRALGRFFSWLLRYRTEAERVLRSASGFLEASISGLPSALGVTTRANKQIQTALTEVDTLLLELIDPAGRKVTERELVDRWDWPQVDIDDLRMREMWED